MTHFHHTLNGFMQHSIDWQMPPGISSRGEMQNQSTTLHACYSSENGSWFLPPVSAHEVIEPVPSIHLFVYTLKPEPFDVRTQNLAQGCTLTISRGSLMVNVIGQRSKSPGWGMWFFSNFTHFFGFGWSNTKHWPLVWPHDMWHHSVTSWHHRLASLGRTDYEIFQHGRCVNARAFSFFKLLFGI